MPAKSKVKVDFTEEQLRGLDREDLTDYLNDNEIAFCEAYIKDYNIKLAAIKAGYAPKSANFIGLKLRSKKYVNNYIAWLKLKVYQKANVEAVDILNFYAKAAYSDITDYVDVTNDGKKVKIKDLDSIDGQLIQEISQNVNGGVNIKLIDKMAAMKRLEAYMDTNPYDWQRKMEERKLAILEEKLQLEKLKLNPNSVDGDEDDGFIEALVKASQNVFSDEVEDDDEVDEIDE